MWLKTQIWFHWLEQDANDDLSVVIIRAVKALFKNSKSL